MYSTSIDCPSSWHVAMGILCEILVHRNHRLLPNSLSGYPTIIIIL